MIPKWDDFESYQFPETITMVDWAWEFLRRNKDYRQAWKQYKNTGESPSRDSLFNSFGVISLCDPDENYDSPLVTALCLREFAPLTIWYWFDPKNESPDAQPLLDQNETGAILVKLNACNDINSQLEQVQEKLEDIRKWLSKEDVSPKSPHSGDFPIYLRLLDAEDQLPEFTGRDLMRRIVPILAPHELEDSVIRRFEYDLKKARRMRNYGYKPLSLEKYRTKPTE